MATGKLKANKEIATHVVQSSFVHVTWQTSYIEHSIDSHFAGSFGGFNYPELLLIDHDASFPP